jgi:polysaccharide chain length determinant protein (PEP-CTERM system associated)
MAGQDALPVRRVAATVKTSAPALTPQELIPVLLHEGRRRMLPLSILFAAIALAAAVVGTLIPKTYSASTTILAQESDIIQPLLEGRAVATGVTDRAGMARQVIFSRKVLDDILKTGGWLGDQPNPVQRDRLIEQIQGRIKISSPRQSLVQITYSDSDPQRTYEVTQRLGDLLISETLATKERESRDAYQFIDSQVQGYYRKLTEAETALQDYRSQNADAQPGSVADTNSRIGSLRTQVETARMELLEQRSRETSLSSQLSGESAVTAVQTRDNLYRAQLMDLQKQLDTLLLTYTEQYPDVVRIRHQMADITATMQQEQQRRDQSSDKNALSEDAQLNPLYQELRSKLADVRRDASATESRLGMSESMLNEELDRGRRIANSESALAELTRDYEVNRDIYQDLLKRRENARVSMELDKEKRGLTLRVQDPAIMPLRPSGLRFMHIALAGLALAMLLPFGLLFLRARFDPRVRMPQQIEKYAQQSLLAVIPTYVTPRERRRNLAKTALSFAICAAVFVGYGVAFVYKQIHA